MNHSEHSHQTPSSSYGAHSAPRHGNHGGHGSHDHDEHGQYGHACHRGHGAHAEARSQVAAEDVPAGYQWTCPMHPEVVSDGPGSCPICGMALEPMVVELGAGPNPEYVEMRRRFWYSVPLAALTLILAMGEMIPGDPLGKLLSVELRTWLQLLFATPVATWGAWPFYQRAVVSVKNRSLNMFTLIGLGVGVAYGFSLFALFLPDLLPAALRHGAWCRSTSKRPR